MPVRRQNGQIADLVALERVGRLLLFGDDDGGHMCCDRQLVCCAIVRS